MSTARERVYYATGRAAGMREIGLLPPRGTRLVLMSDALMDVLAGDGVLVSAAGTPRKVTWQWGEPDEHGWYSPTFTETRLA